jgi:NADPH2:quinone reductase
LIRVKAAGVNPVDTYVRSGNFPGVAEIPYIPGSDAAGIVEAVGDSVSDLKPNDRVYFAWDSSSGTYAEFAVADRLHTFRLPEKISFSQGAALGVPYFTAFRALILKCRGEAGDTVLVHGASGAVRNFFNEIQFWFMAQVER